MLTIREIATELVEVKDENNQTVVKDGKPVTQRVPKLDDAGNEIELYAIPIPREVEAKGGEAIDAYVVTELAKLTAPAETTTDATTTGEEPTDA